MEKSSVAGWHLSLIGIFLLALTASTDAAPFELDREFDSAQTAPFRGENFLSNTSAFASAPQSDIAKQGKTVVAATRNQKARVKQQNPAAEAAEQRVGYSR